MKYRNLSLEDITYLKEHCGEDETSIAQIDRAATKTIYEKTVIENGRDRTVRISRTEARQILGNKQFVSALSRSAFHWTAVSIANDGTDVYFDSSKLFQ